MSRFIESKGLVKELGPSFTWGVLEVNVGVNRGVKNLAEVKTLLVQNNTIYILNQRSL